MDVLDNLKIKLDETNRQFAASLKDSLDESTKQSLAAIDDLNKATSRLKETVQKFKNKIASE